MEKVACWFGLSAPDFLNALGLSLDVLGIAGIWIFGLPKGIQADKGDDPVHFEGHVESNPYAVWATLSMILILAGFGLQLYATVAF